MYPYAPPHVYKAGFFTILAALIGSVFLLASCQPEPSTPIESQAALAKAAVNSYPKNEYYITISDVNLDNFNAQVNEAFRRGYMPIGGATVAISSDGGFCRFSQAMVNSETVFTSYASRSIVPPNQIHKNKE